MLNRLTPAGRSAMLAYGVRTIIDLRGPTEVAEEPSPFAPGGEAAAELDGRLAYRNLPFEAYDPEVMAKVATAETLGQIYTLLIDAYPANVATVMAAIAEAGDGAVVVHCAGGKDRTGLVSALLLEVAGVPPKAIAADYALTAARLMPAYRALVAARGQEVPEAKPSTPPGTMLSVLRHLRDRYGGAYAYLRQAGLSERQIALLRARLREQGALERP